MKLYVHRDTNEQLVAFAQWYKTEQGVSVQWRTSTRCLGTTEDMSRTMDVLASSEQAGSEQKHQENITAWDATQKLRKEGQEEDHVLGRENNGLGGERLQELV